jgi:hypothetical protein
MQNAVVSVRDGVSRWNGEKACNCLPKAPVQFNVPRLPAAAVGGTRRPRRFRNSLRRHRNSIMDFVVIVLIAAAIAAVGAATTLQPKSILRCFMSLI